MPTDIDVEQLRDMLEREGTQLVEVLPEREYEEEHLPGAVSIPLKSLKGENISELDRDRPVIVYCWDDE